MKVYKIFENIVREEEAIERADFCTKSFGKKLFADQLEGDEKNTEKEDLYYKLLKKFTINDFGPYIDHKLISALYELKECMNEYHEILKPDGNVYRGTKINFTYIYENYNKINKLDLLPYTYRANSLIQSWTENLDIAIENFAFGIDRLYLSKSLVNLLYIIKTSKFLNGDDEIKYKLLANDLMYIEIFKFKIPVVLITVATPEQFMFKAKYFKKISAFKTEDEILRIDNKPINCKALVPENMKELCFYIHKFEDRIKKEIYNNKQD